MRILLTGACGLLGRAIIRRGEGAHEFVCIDVSPEVSELPNGLRADFTDEKAVDAVARGCDAIIHTAAMHGAHYGTETATNSNFIATNVFGADTLFRAALKFGIRRVVLSSTMEVLIGKKWDMHGTASLDETMQPRPDWAYPLSKLFVEQLSDFYSRVHSLETVNLRYLYIRDLPLEQIGLNLLARQFTDTDAADANLLAVTLPNLKNEVVHIGPDTALTQEDTNQAMAGHAWAVLERKWPGCESILRSRGLEPDASQFWPVVPIHRAKRLLNWEPESRFENYLKLIGWQGR